MRGKATALVAGLLFKLALAPALILILYAGIFGVEGPVMRVTTFEAAMAPMIGASVVAMDHDLDPPLLALMLGVGIPLSFLTLPAWWTCSPSYEYRMFAMALSVVVINYDFGHRRFSCWCTITTSDTDRLNSAREAKGPAHRMEIGGPPPTGLG